MKTKYWTIIRDHGFYTRTKAVLKRQESKYQQRYIEFWYDTFEGENFVSLMKNIMNAEWMLEEEMEDLLANMKLIQESLYVEQRTAKVSFNKSGGTAKGKAITNRVTIPTTWIKELGITEDDREIKLIFDNEKIIIEKNK